MCWHVPYVAHQGLIIPYASRIFPCNGKYNKFILKICSTRFQHIRKYSDTKDMKNSTQNAFFTFRFSLYRPRSRSIYLFSSQTPDYYCILFARAHMKLFHIFVLLSQWNQDAEHATQFSSVEILFRETRVDVFAEEVIFIRSMQNQRRNKEFHFSAVIKCGSRFLCVSVCTVGFSASVVNEINRHGLFKCQKMNLIEILKQKLFFLFSIPILFHEIKWKLIIIQQ